MAYSDILHIGSSLLFVTRVLAIKLVTENYHIFFSAMQRVTQPSGVATDRLAHLGL